MRNRIRNFIRDETGFVTRETGVFFVAVSVWLIGISIAAPVQFIIDGLHRSGSYPGAVTRAEIGFQKVDS